MQHGAVNGVLYNHTGTSAYDPLAGPAAYVPYSDAHGMGGEPFGYAKLGAGQNSAPNTF
jgi:hypothetical protein